MITKTILVTGAFSFLGKHVIPNLVIQNPGAKVLTPTSKELDLLNRNAVLDYIFENKPNIILHMAAKCGGIGANKAAPAEFIHDNLRMTMHLFDAIRFNDWFLRTKHKELVSYFYGLGSVCGYPKFCQLPFKEDHLWFGYPEETNAPYGIAKRVILQMQQSFRQQFGLKGAHLIPVNLFGPHDHFDLEKSHVIPALINKMVKAKKNKESEVEIWGDGTPTREFLYVEDCAHAIVKAVSSELDYNDPINLGTGKDISIKNLANLIKDIVNVPCKLVFTGETSVNGQPKRCLDVSRAQKVLGFTAKTSLEDGLRKTINWYIENQ